MTVIGKINGGNEPHVFMDVPVGTCVADMIEKAGGIDGTYPVSYTHLDVYKRQEQRIFDWKGRDRLCRRALSGPAL